MPDPSPPSWQRLTPPRPTPAPESPLRRPPPRRSRSSWLVGGLALVLLVLAGLTARAWWMQRRSADDPARRANTPASLRVVTAEVEGMPDQPPVLVGTGQGDDTLVVRVTYAGGCETHDVTLDRETQGDTLVLALDHDANGDDCTDEVYDELRLPVGAASTGPVVLLDPETGERLPVRRVRP